jgi:hypothetical protein
MAEYANPPILKSAPADGQLLQYEAATDRFVPVALGSLPAAVIPQTHIAPEADPSAQTGATVTTANATDLPTAEALANALKTDYNKTITDVGNTIASLEDLVDQFNTLLTELQTAGILSAS